jgi:uncharacterized phiE125 gp8 family phage protein
MVLQTITLCAYEPVSVDEMLHHSRIDSDADYTYVAGLISAARAYIEKTAWLTLMPTVLELVLQSWPGARYIELPQSPVRSVTSVTWLDRAGATQTVSAGDYVVDTARIPGRVVLKSGKSWPSGELFEASAIRVRYMAGYADALGASPAQDVITAARDAVPVNIRHAIKLLVAHWYENREQVTVQAGVSTAVSLPLGIDALIGVDRAFRW